VNRTIVKPTAHGPLCIVWIHAVSGPKIVRILLSGPGLSAERRSSELYPAVPVASCPEIDAVGEGVKRLLAGEPMDFSLHLVDLSRCGPFQRQVLATEHAIPRGRVSTYRLIAARLGKPTGARAVGNALAGNPFPLIVPCHRAIRSDRELGGYQGGSEMKRALLEKEGIAFDSSGRVVCGSFFYGEAGRAARSR